MPTSSLPQPSCEGSTISPAPSTLTATTMYAGGRDFAQQRLEPGELAADRLQQILHAIVGIGAPGFTSPLPALSAETFHPTPVADWRRPGRDPRLQHFPSSFSSLEVAKTVERTVD